MTHPDNRSRRLNVISLFSGCGGLDLGFAMSHHFSIKFSSDINVAAAETYTQNFEAKKVKNFHEVPVKKPLFMSGDIQNLDFRQLQSLFPSIDVVIGGPPCQDFSMARGNERANAGISTERGRLYAYFVKALIYLRPKFFVFENVPGIISDNKGITWDIIREDFSNLSLHAEDIERIAGNGFSGSSTAYFLAYQGIADASAVGVAQKRKRVIIVGVRKDLLETLSGFSAEYLSNKIKKICSSKIEGKGLSFSNYPLTSIEVFEGKPLDALEDRYRNIMEEWLSYEMKNNIPELEMWTKENAEVLKKGIHKNYCEANSTQFSFEVLSKAMKEHREVLDFLKFSGVPVCSIKDQSDISCAVPIDNPRVLSRLYFIPPDKNYKFLYGHECWRVEGKNISMIYRRIHPLKPAYTITANGGGGTHGYHYERTRGRLTNRERARLQSFPDWFKFRGTYAQQREIIGNAVPPLLGKAVAEAVFEIDQLLTGKVHSEYQKSLMSREITI